MTLFDLECLEICRFLVKHAGMKTLIALLGLCLSLSAFASQPDYKGSFAPLLRGVKAKGAAHVYRGGSTDLLVFEKDFAVTDGVVLDVKICGELSEGTASQPICLSLGNLRKLKGYQEYVIPTPFYDYTRAVIFDVDLIQNHAHALLDY